MRSQKAFSMLETVIGIAVLGILAVALAMGTQTGIMASHMANVRTTAEKLAVSQMETIKSGPYVVAQSGEADYTSTIPALPAGYRLITLDSSSTPVADQIIGLPWDVGTNSLWTASSPVDPGIQKITIIVESNAELNSQGVYREIFRLTDFKVNR
jgi:prepilin-type N-terminal cleavage/methylation domain-containing protein